MPPDPYYITTPIYYVNDRPHIGHCYTTVVADVAARFARLLGRDAFFLTGTDEHAEKVVSTARERGLTPRQWADANAAEFRKAFRLMGVAESDFMRTSEDRHISRASAYIKRLMDSGDVYLGDYVGWFDASQEEYLTETVAKEHDFKSPVTGKPLEKRTEKNYFFRLSAYEDRLRAHFEAHPEFVLPEARRNEVLGRLRQGLNDVPVSRAVKEGDADWGILMPGDPGHRVYVWIEALCNYLTAVDEPARRKYWPPAVHVMAKDILWFHAVVWPAMLMALGEPLPRTVYAHAYFVAEGRKMSKSLGNFIEIDLLEAYGRRYSIDAVRWYLATQGPLGATDADFAHARFVEVYNSDLANGIGNCASRVGNMIEKYFGGEVPDPKGCWAFDERAPDRPHANFDWPEVCRVLVGGAGERVLERFENDEALRTAIRLIGDVDLFINATAPFKLAKTVGSDPSASDRLAAILHCCAEAIRIASLLLYPAMPAKMAALWRTWNCSPLHDPEDPDSGFKAPLAELAEWGGAWSLRPGQRIAKGEALFMRADPAEPAPTV
ncbi:MAG: methionine--tRNA ligase [Phycisphaerales bacterium]|nr:methionine--tRNA ligase [Phycisphaerales bacterium]